MNVQLLIVGRRGQLLSNIIQCNIEPVSYTHLDVYKRQLLMSSEFTRLSQSMEGLSLSESTACGVLAPVSYTHLICLYRNFHTEALAGRFRNSLFLIHLLMSFLQFQAHCPA